jgi:hypothetical protein
MMAQTNNCGPVTIPYPCPGYGNPTQTFTWQCFNGYSCGSAYCASFCANAYGFLCNGNNGYVNITAPMGICLPPGA